MAWKGKPRAFAAAAGALALAVSAGIARADDFALRFDGLDDFVTFGPAAALGATSFTLEVWFQRQGTGIVTTTGTGGITDSIPLLTKGRGEADVGSHLDMNYHLAIRQPGGLLAADFEESASGATPGLNHPLSGGAAVTDTSFWHHAAVTYDLTNLSLYLDGALQAQLPTNQPPRSDSIQHAALGTAMTSAGAPAGYFRGLLDEPRIWSYARSAQQIRDGMRVEYTNGVSGLLGRWGLNEGSGVSVSNSANPALPGAISNGAAIVAGYPFAYAGTGGLLFDGANDCVTLGPTSAFGLSNFTLEVWFKRLGPGSHTNTGSGGLSAAVPLISKGRAGAGTADVNYFFGITSDGFLGADFEEGPGGASPGASHPVVGTNAVSTNVWTHGAVTYDGTNWALYFNGALDSTQVVGQPTRHDSANHAGLGSALNTNGVPGGFFHGVLDEARIWNYARTAGEIASNLGAEIVSAPGLVGRWGLGEERGFDATNSANTSAGGTLINGPVWAQGSTLTVDYPPVTPVLDAPTNGTTNAVTSPVLQATVSDPEGTNLTVTFYGRVKVDAGPDFTLVALPDTQYYTSSKNGGTPAHFYAQVGWIISNRAARKIEFVTQLGDCTESGSTTNLSEWMVATQALYRLEDPVANLLAEGIPYGVCVGNHDQSEIANADGSTFYYNMFFGSNHFAGRSYYGGAYGFGNTGAVVTSDNHFELFTAGGLDFVIVHAEWDTSPNADVIAWINGVYQAFSNRIGIFATHYMVESTGLFSGQGSSWFNGIKSNANLRLCLCGHVPTIGEARRTDVVGGNTIHSILTDYQGRSNGGDGWLRIYEFSPSNNVLRAYTYSPTLNQFETDDSSQFTLAMNLSSGSAFAVIGVVSNVPSGSPASTTWSNLATGTMYEWYAVASDGMSSSSSGVSLFTTAGSSDEDGDGLPDAWELQYFGTTTNAPAGDVDGDGMFNGDEYIAGTVPTNGASYFRVAAMALGAGPTNRLITAATQPGKKYIIFFSDSDLAGAPAWSGYANTNNGVGTWVETNPLPTTHSFFDNDDAETTLGPPVGGRRTYRVVVGDP